MVEPIACKVRHVVLDFEFNVMPFSLTKTTSTFQRLMECTLVGLTPEQCLIYLDDVITFTTSFQEHLQRQYLQGCKMQDSN